VSYFQKTEKKETPTTSLIKKTALTQSNIKYPDWYISISFGKSSSQNYPQAVALARMAVYYFENDVEGNILHQAIYSSESNEYLKFIKLYELVSNWKSCFIVINGEFVDRKIISGINYCYGDKCRSGNPEFCYGASLFTENPFGCHRFQTSAYNNPWWSYGEFDTKEVWHVDKEAILDRLKEYSQPYRLCPSFLWDRAIEGLKSLPNTIDVNKNQDWVKVGNRIVSKSKIESLTYRIEIDLNKKLIENIKPQKAGGCGYLSILVLILLVAIIIFILAL